MLSFLLSRNLAAAAVAFAAWGAASSAHARTDVTFSIGIQVPAGHVYAAPVHVHPRHVHVQPRPVFVQPRPVFVQPRPVYLQPAPVFVQPRPVFIQAPAYGQHYGKGHGWRRGQWERAHGHAHRGQQGHGGKHGGHRD